MTFDAPAQQGPFDSLDQHVADSTQEHLLLSLTKLSEVSDRLDKTNGILTKTMNALAETAEEVGALKRQLAATCTKKIRIMIGYKGSKPPQALPYDSPISSGTVTTGSVLYNSGTVWFSGVGFVVYLSIKNKETWCFHLGLSDEEGANNGQPTSVKVKWMVDVNSGEATYVRRALYAQLVRGGQFIGFAVDQQITALLNSGAVSKDSVNEVLYLEATVSVYVHSVKFGTKPRSGTKSLANGLWPDAPF